MKKLENVCERNDYKRLNGVLKQRVNDICALVAEKMEELEVGKIKITENLTFRRVSYYDGSEQFVLVQDAERPNKDFFACDCNCCWTNYDTYNSQYVSSYYQAHYFFEMRTEHRLAILNHVSEIADELKATEDEKAALLKSALGIKDE